MCGSTSSRFIPEDRGRLVTAFLTSFFERYVEYDFTADLENQLDDISGGRIDWKEVLRNFWRDFSDGVDGTKDLKISQVIDALDEDLGPHFFPDDGTGSDPRALPGLRRRPAVAEARPVRRLHRLLELSRVPLHPRLRGRTARRRARRRRVAAAVLGNDPATGLTVALKKGPYGPYLQLGEAENGSEAEARLAAARA